MTEDRKLTDADAKAVAKQIIEELMDRTGRGLLSWLLKTLIGVAIGIASWTSFKGH